MTAAAGTAGRRRRFARLRELVRAEDGAALTEFGLILPALLMLLFGAFDVGHTLYMRSVLQGAIQKAARDSSLETAAGTVATARDNLDDAVERQLRPLHNSAEITFERRFYRTFSDAAAAEAEEFTDSASGTFADGICNNNESFDDRNNNGHFDEDGGDSVDRAGARDNVIYTVTVEYPRMFPLHKFVGLSDTTRLEASTILANQPYGDQQSYDAATEGHCP